MNNNEIKSVLVTGANAGIGKEIARQFSLMPSVSLVYLACRNEQKAQAAKRELEEKAGRKIFKIVILDVTNLTSVRSALSSLKEPIDVVILNAGGAGGKSPMVLTRDGVSYLFAQNVLGHVVLLEGMLAAGLLSKAAVFAGSEAARGVPKMKIKRPALPTSSPGEFASIITGQTYAGKKLDIFSAYGDVKYVGALWMASLARRSPGKRLLTISPGGTQGTEAATALPAPMRLFYNYVFMPILAPALKLAHSLETGSKRIVNGVTDQTLESGHFYGSKANVLTGPLIDQIEIFSNLGDPRIQDNADEAIHRFTGKSG